MKKAALLFAGLVSIGVPAMEAWAELKISPSIGVREEYNDNIYLSDRDEEEDFITTVNPSVNLKYTSRFADLSLDYGFNFRYYANNTKENETSLRQAQRIKLENTFSHRDIFFLRVANRYERVPIETRRQVALDNFITNMTDSNTMIINPYMDYPVTGTLRLNAGYLFENRWYKAKEGDDADNHLFTVGVTKELTSLISTSLSYGYYMHRAELSEDYDRQNASAGISWKVLPTLTLSGSVGRMWFDYDEGNDLNSNIWDVKAAYELTPRITLSAAHSRSFSDSVNLGTLKNESTSASIGYKGTIPVTLTVFNTNGKYHDVNRKDETNGISLDAGLEITPRLKGSIRGSYSTTEHHVPDEVTVTTEEIDRYSVGVSLSYEMKITTVSIGYTYNTSDSTISGSDYDNNIVWVQARFAF